MALGSVTIRVRPLRVAFLIDPTDRAGLYRAIELSTSLWGGRYNPIIPAYSRTPINWESHKVKRLPTPAEIVDGYLEGFDPDLVVPIGKCASRSYDLGNRDLVSELDLVGEIERTLTPRFGIGIVELIADFLEKELKYKRNDNLRIGIPITPRANRSFLASVFGAIPPRLLRLLNSEFAHNDGITQIHCTLPNLLNMWQSGVVFLKRLTSWSLRAKRHATLLFVCDATSSQDVMDYWNLCAAGYDAVPIPIQIAANEDVKNFAKDLINSNYQPDHVNRKPWRTTTIQSSRTVTEETASAFCASLNTGSEEDLQRKFLLRWWYPRFWDSWARETAEEGIAFPYGHEESHQILENETRLDLRAVNPKVDIFPKDSARPRFANDISLWFYSPREPMAEVIPKGSRELSYAIARYGFHSWRLSNSGPVFLACRRDDLICLELPRAEAIMKEWFRERGWKVELSVPGRIAGQLLQQLGGLFKTSWLAHRGIVQLLCDLEGDVGLARQAVIQRLKQVISDSSLRIRPEGFLEALLASNAIQLGATIQCPVCKRHGWFQLNALRYDLTCRCCLSVYSVPQSSPNKIKWAYRTQGPYVSSISQGSFSVLLTLRFIAFDGLSRVTPLLSYKAERHGEFLEADLTCLHKRAPLHKTRIDVVHAECKSFNHFQKDDLARMRRLIDAFPGSVLIFATLNGSLGKSERKMISDLVLNERRKRLRSALYSPVIILTAAELFCHSVHECWKERGGPYQRFQQNGIDHSDLYQLANATQELYLGLPSWPEWSEAELEKRRLRKVAG